MVDRYTFYIRIQYRLCIRIVTQHGIGMQNIFYIRILSPYECINYRIAHTNVNTITPYANAKLIVDNLCCLCYNIDVANELQESLTTEKSGL